MRINITMKLFKIKHNYAIKQIDLENLLKIDVFFNKKIIFALQKSHIDGRERTTKFYRPFKLIYSEVCDSRPEARLIEKYWKSGVGKEKLRRVRDSLK